MHSYRGPLPLFLKEIHEVSPNCKQKELTSQNRATITLSDAWKPKPRSRCFELWAYYNAPENLLSRALFFSLTPVFTSTLELFPTSRHIKGSLERP